MSFQIPNADALVEFVKNFTGSSDDAEIKKCIYMAELSMRNIELPALRTNPYDSANIGVANAQGQIPIPPRHEQAHLVLQTRTTGWITIRTHRALDCV